MDGEGKKVRQNGSGLFFDFRVVHVNKIVVVTTFTLLCTFGCYLAWYQIGSMTSFSSPLRETVPAGPRSYGERCTSERQKRLVALRLSNRDHCPYKDGWWLPFCVNLSSALARPLVHVNIGCNKGFDFLANLEDLSGDEKYSPLAYYDRLAELNLGFNDPGACNQALRPVLKNRTKPTVSPPRQVIGYCFEPMPDTVVSLKAGMESLGENVVVAPIALSSYHGETFFTNFNAGSEIGGITKNSNGHRVVVTTLDHFAAENRLNVIDLLSIDTEGNDMRVLYGAVNFLSAHLVRVIEFEVHTKGQWGLTRVDNLIDLLDNLGFDCYWAASQKMPLLRITGCTDEKYENDEVKRWSNVACANRAETELAELFEAISLTTENDPNK